MAIEVGQQLLHYRIVEKLGEGGMGVVWKAQDTALDRAVAIKVLPEAFLSDENRLQRFEREAKLLASLNHPSIAAIYGLHEATTPAGPVRFIAMELVEGEDLAVRLARGPIPVDDALAIAARIADGFAAAHDQGVIHRDLKPANVMLTPDGKVKILDFGLAKAFAPESTSGSGRLSLSPTLTSAGTVAGTLLGTAAYMSPEQARGKTVDRRADVWAFGCVLFEMLTARQAFGGETITDVLASIVRSEPDWDRLPEATPAAVRRLLQRCLRKDVDTRVRDLGDLRVLLEEARAGVVSGGVPSRSAPAPADAPRRRWLWPAVAGALAVLLVATWVVGPRGRGAVRADATPGPESYILATTDLQPSSAPLLSPDGLSVVFSVRDGVEPRLARRDLASFRVTPIEGTEGGKAPFFSPDGSWIGFVTPDEIKRVPVGGGVAQVIAKVSRVSAGDWGDDGWIWFTLRGGGEDGMVALSRVRETGGEPEIVARLAEEESEFESWLPEVLPDGRSVLISIFGGSDSYIVAVLPDGSRRTLVDDAFLARFVEPGTLLYRDEASEAVVAVPFDPSRVETTGAAVAVTEPVDSSYCFDVSQTGALVYVPVPGAGEGEEVVWADRSGAISLASDTRAEWIQPRVSPDGKSVLLRKAATNCELWILDVERGTLARAVSGHDAHDAVWGPDGRRIAYRPMDEAAIVVQTVRGAREVRTLVEGDGSPTSWSPRGDLLAFTRSGRGTRDDIWIVATDGSSDPQPFLETEFNERAARFSPDGRFLAYMSDESGSTEVFVRSVPDGARTWQVSTGGGRDPVWSRDGRELFFHVGDTVWSAPVRTGDEFSAGKPVRLFDADLGSSSTSPIDVAPDGRFVIVRSAAGKRGDRELRLIRSWPEAMRRMTGSPH